ncbi:hypothetical protein EV361DRAFT_1034837 [Lentinula raphanica]|nr:hypothetical protein F5880DRAFT_1502695 [Lentinula raphanica]KAJ3969783.1 hypothetical protein EV361DRAFT_1034837 [Lentinula raphanica]
MTRNSMVTEGPGGTLGEAINSLLTTFYAGDVISRYFSTPELLVACVKDTRFQAFMPNVLVWMGIMNIEYRQDEIDAKIESRYLSSGKQITEEAYGGQEPGSNEVIEYQTSSPSALGRRLLGSRSN